MSRIRTEASHGEAMSMRNRELPSKLHKKNPFEQPLTLRGSDYAHDVQELNKAIDRAERLLQ
jgi:hypothetical protein